MDLAELKKKDNLKLKLLLGIVSVILLVIMFPKGESIESEVSEGSIWIHNDLIAPFSFPVKKDPALYKGELNAAQKSVFPVFEKQKSIENILDSLKSYNSFLLQVTDSALSSDTVTVNATFLTSESFNTIKNLRRQERNFTAARKANLNEFFNEAANVLTEVYTNGIINKKEGEDSIAVRQGNIDKIENINLFITTDEANTKAREIITAAGMPEDFEEALYDYIEHFISPNIIYSEEMTREEIDQAQSNVTSYSGIVNENERIIGKHDRITREGKLKIESYKEAKGDKIGTEGFLLQLLGKGLHVTFLLSLFTIYLLLFRKKIFYDNSKLLLIAVIMLFISFITFLVNQVIINEPLYLLIFIPSASMLLTIIFDSRVGFYSTVILCLIAGALRGNDYVFAATNIFAGALAVYTVRDIKNRNQIFRSFLFILLGYLVAVTAFSLESFADPRTIMYQYIYAASNSLISPVLTYGLLIFFEKFFKITTDLTLLELSNFDRPLLKDLARKAPGTFNHSMTMGTLAETAAEKIGANPLLARVGAYYHDIGKTITPQNFVENQLNNQNIHENLSPEESVNLIIRHVNEGIELAREQGLPNEIIDFIPMHHGTSVMPFFYEKAKKLYGEEKVKIEDYSYPGPMPNTKETAIVMLADGSESAVRSIEEPDPKKVENVINKIIQTRIDTGQLNNSPLTFSDIHKIKEAFISILLGQHHKRIRYPHQDEVEKGTGPKES